MRSLLCFLIALPLLAQAPQTTPAQQTTPAPDQPTGPAPEDWLTGTIDVGYRYITGVGGDFNTYRSVIDLGEGPKLFNADLTIRPEDFADQIDIHASSWGGDPYNTFRLDARRKGVYNFSFDYRNIAYFNFLPSYANPGAINPALPFLNQYGFDIFRRMADVRLEFLPGHRIIPYVEYDRNGGRGQGTTNFVLQQNEYTVPTDYSDHTNEALAGVRFEFNRWHLTLEGGGLNDRNDQQVLQGSVLPNPGNRTTPFLGQQLLFNGGLEAYGIRGGAKFARGLFTANPVSWVDISGSFLYSQLHTDVNFTQLATGNLFQAAAFFNAEMLGVTGNARQPNPSGNVSVTLHPFGDRFRLIETWMTDRLHDDGAQLVLDQTIVTGALPTMASLANATQFVVNYNRQETDLLFDVTKFFTVRAGQRYVWGDTTAPATLNVTEGDVASESGVLRQNVVLAGATVRLPLHLRLTADFEDSPGQRTYFRTSLNDYQKGRAMLQWRPSSSLEVSATADVLQNQNPDPSIRYDFLSRAASASVNWNPTGWKGFGFLGEYSRSTVYSNITYLIPNEANAAFNGFASALSQYRENAHTGTALAEIPLPGSGTVRPKLSMGGSFFISSGSRPARFYEPTARFSVPVVSHVEFWAEWHWYALSQPFYLYEGFRSNQFDFALRLSM
jgi:hypothetical protein